MNYGGLQAFNRKNKNLVQGKDGLNGNKVVLENNEVGQKHAS